MKSLAVILIGAVIQVIYVLWALFLYWIIGVDSHSEPGKVGLVLVFIIAGLFFNQRLHDDGVL